MSGPYQRPSSAALRAVREMADRRLSQEEFDAYVDAPMGQDELEGNRELIDWFCRRYPTPLARLESGRRAWLNAKARMPLSDD